MTETEMEPEARTPSGPPPGADLSGDGRPRLQEFVRVQHDRVRDRWVLQAPERVLLLDDTGKTILDRCTGAATLDAIVAGLAEEYDAPEDVIAQDVRAVLGLLAERDFLVMEPGTGDG